MDWFDIDHNGIVDGRDFFILYEIFGFDEEDKQEEDCFSNDGDDDSDDEVEPVPKKYRYNDHISVQVSLI